MDQLHPAQGAPTRTTHNSPNRRLVAFGTIRHHGGRTITVRATEAGVTGTISTHSTGVRRG
ncbi:hypothetical protein [Streptomyces roseolus]